ncbi:MAG: bifunctional DNA-formamidopyrimidine glycosylase/DNA-(apurinic or apyrimidinic site) lyase [Acidimicrobiales bacterium]
MPELPEVETIRRQLDPLLSGSMVLDGGAHPSDKFNRAPLAVGATLGPVRRRGKYLLIDLDDGSRELVVHLGMTGVFSITPPQGADGSGFQPGPYTRAWWRLAHEQHGETVLVFDDVRRFGRVVVVERGDYADLPTLAALGPDPFDGSFTAEGLWRALGAGSQRLKTQLLSQRPVAGVGNIYADEAFWLARVHPARRGLTRAQALRLHEAIISVLRQGLEAGGTTLRDYRGVDGSRGENQHGLACYGRSGQPCGRCGEPLLRRVWDGRSTTFCPRCQGPTPRR